MSALSGKILPLLFFIFIISGCSSYQPTKNIWKSTKGLWNEYLSPPANVDYDDKGELPKEAMTLSHDMMGVDLQLAKLERTMQNADKPPTQQWLDQLFETFPWLNGFAGIKNNGTILGQQPAESMKELDFIPLLYEDKKQSSRALRADVQPSPLGPEILLASPLYDSMDFLGIVVAYFDMRSVMSYSKNPEDLVVLCPTALLWPGKYEFAATPMAGVDWAKVVKESSSGTCSNEHGSFYYVVRYLGNLPLIFATPKSGDFPAGNGNIDQGFAFFPQTREKLPVPPVAERRSQNMREISEFGHNPDESIEEPEMPAETVADNRADPNELQPGSQDSILLKGGKGKGRQIQERPLEGENVPVERPLQRRRPTRREIIDRQIEMIRQYDAAQEKMADTLLENGPEETMPSLPGGRPSPFGPQQMENEEQATPTLPGGRPSPFGPAKQKAPEVLPLDEEIKAPSEPEPEPEKIDQGPTLPGGRPSPFGPR